MKKAIAVALLLSASTAFAAVMGILVRSEAAQSPAGTAYGWNCTYSVSGRNVTVFSKNVCPPSMMFD
jgi:hypothetical protein